MMSLLRPGIEYSVRRLFGVDIYPDAFEKLAILDRSSRLSGLFQHKVPQELKRHPLLFIHVPKNGGTSLKRALYGHDPGHSTVRLYDWLSRELRANALCFALVRDPIDRFLSAFDFLMNGGGSDVSIQPAARRRLASIRTIDQFLDHLESIGGDWFKIDTFARPQWWYVVDRSGAIAVDRLWVIGEQDAEIAALLEARGFPPPTHANRTRRAARRLSPQQKARIEHIYASDLAIYDAVSRVPGASGAELAHIVVPQV
jgi:hypothetical protein